VNTYPSLPTAWNPKGDRSVRRILTDEAWNGMPHTRVVHDRRRRSFDLLHPWLSLSQRNQLVAFFDANVGVPFIYERVRNGITETYTCVFVGEGPQEEFLKTERYNVAVQMREV